MGKKLCAAVIGLAFFGFSACKKGQDQSFHWVGQGKLQLKMPLSPCPIKTPNGEVQGVLVVGSGTMHGEHIEPKATWTSSECGSKTSPYFGGGLLTITTENGDVIRVDYHGTCKHESAALMTCQEVDTITGGTGRFADAKGSATGDLKAHFTFDKAGNLIMPWTADLDYTGKVSF